MHGLFYGIGAAVIAIIARSAFKLARLTLKQDRVLWCVSIASAVVTAWTESEIVWLFLLSGVIVWIVRRFGSSPSRSAVCALLPAASWLVTGLRGPADLPTLGRIGWYFTAAGTFVFGSGLAIVPFLYGSVVNEHHWLNERQFIDAVAVAMITPGPVVITVGFIGYLIAGFPGATVAALATFLPCYLFTIIPAPYFHKYGKRPGIIAFVDGVTAAAVGTITGAVVVLGKRSITDIPTIAMLLITILLLWKVKKLPEPVIVAVAAVAGLVVYPLVKS
jgi:chromate transporter